MHRIVTLLLIGLLALFSVPRTGGAMGMGHDMARAAQDAVAQDTTSEDAAALTMIVLAHQHSACPDCPGGMSDLAQGDIPCPHGALCMIVTVTGMAELRVARAMRFVDYPTLAIATPVTRAPALDLPPPRIGFGLV
ncbi:hypothetical protein [Celeribacter neptunius]|uniref:Uncharacterized protein n=1 Tax=Celeribacter neptunius TaxID=588602 RepID=A0A1I3NSR6_9RHOB|nr:hypothetical protein [Celeribacter neptunius]SFJ12358.1 hypothetical protein SAMN04487991_1465 [Celeribacter neptunius]